MIFLHAKDDEERGQPEEQVVAGDEEEPEFGLGVAQIVITAATPVAEEPDRQFPPSEEEEENQKEQEQDEEKEQQHQKKQQQQPKKEEQEEEVFESEKEEALMESPESPQSPPKQVQGGRASIPDELEPDQLARLQDLKESNA